MIPAFRHGTGTASRVTVRAYIAAIVCLVSSLSPARAIPQVGLASTSAHVQPAGSSDTTARPPWPTIVDTCVDAHVQFQVLERAQQWSEAMRVSNGCAQASCPNEIRADCLAWSRALERRMPVVRVLVEAKPHLPVTLRLNDREVAKPSSMLTLRLDPGAHEIAASQAGQTARVRLTLLPGDERDVTLVLLPILDDPAQQTGLQWWQWGVGAVGAAALVGFVVLGAQAQQAHATASASCAPLCTDDTVRRINRRALEADIALSLAAASGLVLWLSWPNSGSPAVGLAPPANTAFGIRADNF